MNRCVQTFKRAIGIVCVVIGVAATAEGAAVTLAWDPNSEPDITGYRVSYGTTSGQYTSTVDVGNTTTHTFSNLPSGYTYYFVVQAYNAQGTSLYSNEVSTTLASSLTVSNLTANRASPQIPGTTISFSATAAGGTPPYQYKWWIIAGTTQTVGSNWSTNSNFAWRPTAANNYTIRVWARNASSTADAPDNPAAILEMGFAIASSADTTPPTAPGTLTVTPSGTQIALSWIAATDNVGVTGYRIERCQGVGCSSFAQIATTTGATTYTNTGLANGTSYSYRVRATDAATLLGPYSSVATATTPATVDTTPPTAPGTLTATPSGTQIALAWIAATDNVGVTGYRIERCQGAGCSSFAQIATTTGATTYTNTGLANGVSYSYRVRATDAATLLGPYSNTASASTASPPIGGLTGLLAGYSFNAGGGTTAVDSSGNGITGTLAGATWTTAGKYGNALSFNGTSAYVDLGNPTALQGTGSTTWAAWVFATGTPADDGQIIAKSDDSSGWQLKTSPDTGPHTFAIAISGSSGRVQRYSTTVRALNTWYHVAGVYNATARTLDIYVNGVPNNGVLSGTVPAAQVIPNTNVNIGRRLGGFYFRGVIDDVRVYNRALAPAEISQILSGGGSDTQPPTAPAGLIATAVSSAQINLSWTAATDNVGVTGYRIERCAGAGCSNFAEIATTTGATAFTNTGLTASTSYRYRVRAADAATLLSPYSNIATVTTPAAPDTTPPTAPGTVTASPSGTQITLSWSAAKDNVGVTGYRIERCAGTGCSNFAEIATTTGATAFTNTGLTASTSYSYRVRATDAATLLGPYSNVATATTPAAVDTTPPTAPGTLTATPSGTQIALNWAAAKDNVGVTGYRIERCQGTGCSNFAQIATTTGTTTYINTGLASGASYSYRVRATDAAALLGPYSNTASASTASPPVGGLTGLLAGYSFNAGGATTAVDSSGNGITGTLVGATWTTAGKNGNALSFNGTSAYVDLGNPAALQGTGTTTWAAWVFASGAPADDGQIIAKSDSSSGWQLKTSPDTGPHTFGVAVTGTSGRVQRYSRTVRALNTWYHVAGVYNATARTLDIYVNGVLDNGVLGGTVPAAQVASNVNVNIGRRSGGFYFRGVIDDVRIYNRALTPAEIGTLMTNP